MIGFVQAFHLGYWDRVIMLYPFILIATIAGFALFWRPPWYDRMVKRDDEAKYSQRDSNSH